MAVLVAALSSCCGCGKKSKSAIALNGTEWHLIQLAGENITSDNYKMTLGADGRIAGIAECNRFSGTFTQNLKELSIADNLVSTRMMCLANQARENDFMKMLAAIDSYSIDGDRLMLIQSGDVQAIFEALPAAPAAVPAN